MFKASKKTLMPLKTKNFKAFRLRLLDSAWQLSGSSDTREKVAELLDPGRVCVGLGFRVWGLGFRVWGLGF